MPEKEAEKGEKMGRAEKETFVCQHCGAEADLTLEGVEGVREVVERHGKVICKTCGSELSVEPDKGRTFVCHHCGAEADISLEGFEDVKDVLKRGRKMICKSCGREML